MTITETSRGYELQFDFRPHIVAEVKAMPGHRFFGKEKGWFIPHVAERKNPDQSVTKFYNKDAMMKFKAKYLKITPGSDAPEQLFKMEELPELTIDIPWKSDAPTPYPFQNNCIARGIQLKKFINACQPGLGKSCMAIGTVLGLEKIGTQSFPCLVICPSSLKENWSREFEKKFSNKRTIILTDQNKNTWHQYYRMGMADVFIVNYESLRKYFVISISTKKNEKFKLEDINFNPTIRMFKSVIIDELHRLKDPTIATSRIARGITFGKEIIIGLTGTPVVNKPRDLISQLQIIEQLNLFGGEKYFLDRYCEGGVGRGNLAELNGKLNRHCFFRKEKKDVLKDLPDKINEVFNCDISTRDEYDLASKDIKKYLQSIGYTDKQVDKSMEGEIMVQIGKLKAISARGKLHDAIEHIQEVVDAGEKIVVFIHQKFMAEAMMKAFPNSVCVRGQQLDPETGKEKPQSSAIRQAAVDKFQMCNRCNVKQEDHDKVKDHDFEPNNVNVMVASIKAAGVGITLTAASRLIFLELPWHPADVEQCSDRIHRITQKNAAQIGFFLGKNTIDEDIYKLIEEKRKVADAITGTVTDISTIITDLTRSLFNQK